MFANNWKVCPRCQRRAAAKAEALAAELAEAYARMTRDQFRRLYAKTEYQAEPNTTLREDWSLATDDQGQFSVSYHCSCRECGFSFSFKHHEQCEV